MAVAKTVAPVAAEAKEETPVAAAVVEPARNIFQLISLISAEAGALAPMTSQGLKFSFRGVDQVVAHLSPFMRKYGVIIVPNIASITVTPKDVGSRVVKTTELTTRFDFYAPDGSMFSATTAGLSDDFGDKGTAQAQSVAFRICLLQTFALPTHAMEPEETSQAVEDGRAPAVAKDESVAAGIRAQIMGIINDAGSPYTGDMVNTLGDKLTGKSAAAWMQSASDLKKIIAAMEKGEVVDATVAA